VTTIEALAVIGVVRRGAIPQDFTDERLLELAAYLVPLPIGYCRRAAERWGVSVPTDQHGQPIPKFISEPAALLTACGVPTAARHLLDRALRDGGEVFPSARGAIGDGGWEYVPAGEPLPRGVGEFYANAGLPLPAGRRVDPSLPAPAVGPTVALPAGEPITEEQRLENLRRLGSLSRSLGARRRAEPARTPRRTDPAPAVLEAELEAFEARRAALERGAP
jgi:hypothetical protein